MQTDKWLEAMAAKNLGGERPYIRVRVFQDQAVDLAQLLFFERNRLVEQKILERTADGAVSEETRRKLHVANRLWREITFQMDVIGWERP